WMKRDPITMFRDRLINQYAAASPPDLDAIDSAIDQRVEEALAFAREAAEPDPATVRASVYADPLNPPAALAPSSSGRTVTTGWLDAVRDGIAEEMRRDPHILYFGEGTGERGGTF